MISLSLSLLSRKRVSDVFGLRSYSRWARSLGSLVPYLFLSPVGCPSLFLSPLLSRSLWPFCRRPLSGTPRERDTVQSHESTALDGSTGTTFALVLALLSVRRPRRCSTTRPTRRTRSHARTHGYFHASRGRDATSVRTTTSTSPPYAFVAAIFFGDTMAIRESRNACAYLGVIARGRCALVNEIAMRMCMKIHANILSADIVIYLKCT